MKKLMAIFGAALLLAGVATSCSKICTCTVTGTVDGESFSETVEDINLNGSSFKNCNSYGKALNSAYAYVSGAKIKCKAK